MSKTQVLLIAMFTLGLFVGFSIGHLSTKKVVVEKANTSLAISTEGTDDADVEEPEGEIGILIDAIDTPSGKTGVVHIQAHEDNTVIRSVRLNNGKCTLDANTTMSLNKTIHLDKEGYVTIVTANCKMTDINVIEIQTGRELHKYDYTK